MKKISLIQSPSKFYDAVPVFYKEMSKLNVFDEFHVVTDHKSTATLGDNCYIWKMKHDLQFSSNIIQGLLHIDSNIIFLSCEDHVPTERTNREDIVAAFDFMDSHQDIGFLRLTNNNKIKFAKKKKTIGIYREIDATYDHYVSLQPAFWRVEFLRLFLYSGENAWDFEKNVKSRLNLKKYKSFAVVNTIYHAYNFFKSGKFYREDFVDYAMENNIQLSHKYDVMTSKGKNKKYILKHNEYLKNFGTKK